MYCNQRWLIYKYTEYILNPLWLSPQSRQSAKLFSSLRNWDSRNPSPAGECTPSSLGPGGGAHSLAREGLGESQFRRGDIHCGTLYIYVLCDCNTPKVWANQLIGAIYSSLIGEQTIARSLAPALTARFAIIFLQRVQRSSYRGCA